MPVQHSVINVKVLVGAFNQEKALVGAFSLIVKLQNSRRFVSSPTSVVTALALLEVAPCVHLSGCSIKCSGGRDKAVALCYHSYLSSPHLVDVF